MDERRYTKRTSGTRQGNNGSRSSFSDPTARSGKKVYSKDRGPSYGSDGRNSFRGGDRQESRGSYKRFDRSDRPVREHREFKKPVKEIRPENTAEETPIQQTEENELPYLIIGRNAVREALKNGRSIDRILVIKDHDGSLGEIVTMARDQNMLLQETDRKKLDELCMPFGHGGKTANHQGIVAYAAGVEYCSVKDILNAAKEKGEDPFVIVLDGIEDPHNLGSIIRSAECAGAHGVIIGKRRSASVTSAAVKASAGATEYMKIAKVVNITGALEELKRAGLWIAGADMEGTSMDKQGLNGPLALVIGSEGSGLTKLVRETCDFLVSIPLHGQIDSLNAGVAAGILMFEKRRQDVEKA